MPLLAGSINFQDVSSGLGLTPSFRQRLYEISAFILTPISACRCMSSDLSRVASQSYVSYAVFDDLTCHLCISRWSSPLSYRDWTTEMRHWPVFRPACLAVSSPSSTRQLGRLPVSVVRSILQMLSPVSTGSERRSASVQTGRYRLPSSSRRCTSVPIGPASVRC